MPGSTIPRQNQYVKTLLQEEGPIAKGKSCEGLPKEIIHTMIENQVENEFETTSEYVEIQHILAEMRGRPQKRNLVNREKTKMITVRLPESLHAALMQEANDLNTSMNKLCISKLLQIIDKDLVQ